MARWVAGQSGNVHGRPKRRSIEDEVRFRLARFRGRDRKEITDALIECAKAKRPWAVKIVVDLDLARLSKSPSDQLRVDEMSSEQRLARLNELLANPDVRTLLVKQLGDAEVVQ